MTAQHPMSDDARRISNCVLIIDQDAADELLKIADALDAMQARCDALLVALGECYFHRNDEAARLALEAERAHREEGGT